MKEEVDKLNSLYSHRENELNLINQGLQNEVNALKQMLINYHSNTESVNSELKNSLYFSEEHFSSIENYKIQFEQYKSDLIKFTELYEKSQSELKNMQSQNLEIISKISNQQILQISNEEIQRKMHDADEKIRVSEQICEQKILEKDAEISRLKHEFLREKKNLITACQNLRNEKTRIENLNNENIEKFNEKIKNQQFEIYELSNCIKILLEQGEQQKSIIKMRCFEVNENLIEMANEYKENNENLLKLSDIVKVKNEEIEKMINSHIEKLKIGTNINIDELQKMYEKELENLKSQILVKDKEIRNLKDSKLCPNTPRKNITECMNELYAFIDNSRENEQLFLKDINEIKEELQKCTNTIEFGQSKSGTFLLKENEELRNELEKINEKLNNFENLQLNFEELKLEFEKLQNINSSNNDLIQSLQYELISKSPQKPVSADIQKAKIEILRLSTENEELLNENSKLKEIYENKIMESDQKYEKRNLQFNELSSIFKF